MRIPGWPRPSPAGNNRLDAREELAALTEICRILTSERDFVLKCQGVLEVLGGISGSDFAILRELDSEGVGLRKVAIHGDTRGSPSDVVPLSTRSKAASKAFMEDRPLIIDDYAASENPHQGYLNAGFSSLAVVPINFDGSFLGTLGFASKDLNHYSDDSVRMLTALTGTMGMLMANAKLMQERAEANEKLAKLVHALEFTDDAVAFADGDGQIEYMNQAARAMTENSYQENEETSGGLMSVQEFDLTSETAKILKSALENGWSGEIQHRGADGADRNVSLSTDPVVNPDGEVIGLIGVGRDVTERARMEQDLRALSEEREVEANIGRIVSSPLDTNDVFERFRAELTKIIPMDRLVINAIDLENETFIGRFHYGRTIPDFDDTSPNPYTGTLTGIIVSEGTGVIVNEGDPRLTSGEFEVIQRFVKGGYRFFMGVPLIFGDQMVGGLSICRCNEPFTREELAQAERIGNMLSGTMANFNLEVERRHAETESRESMDRFEQIAEHISGAFWLADMRPRKVLYVSPRVEQVWGLTRQQLYEDSLCWLELVHPDDRERVEKSALAVAETGEFNEEFRIIREDGSVRWIHNRGFPINDEAGNFYRMGGIVEDVTEERETARELAESRRLASIGELSAGVAHEINNPLTSIVLYSRALLQQELPDDLRQDIQVVSSQADRAVRVVKNLLEFARKAEPAPQNLSLGTLLRRTLEMKSYDFRLNGITVVEDIPESLPLSAVDEHMMVQVFLNLLNNAEQACAPVSEGGEIGVAAFESGNKIHITFRDNGPGIPEDRLGRIFEPFFTTKEVGFGTGLGLSVSHGVITQHGGSIWAENRDGGGAAFHIEIPVAEMPISDWSVNNGDSPAEEPTDKLMDADQADKRVLVVDDEPAIRKVLARHLEKRNYVVDLASDGEEAWRKIQQAQYDCVLLDLRMPGINGQQLYELVNAGDPNAAARIIFITGDTANPASQGFLESIQNNVVAKPFDFNDVMRQVAQVASEPPSESIRASRSWPDFPYGVKRGVG